MKRDEREAFLEAFPWTELLSEEDFEYFFGELEKFASGRAPKTGYQLKQLCTEIIYCRKKAGANL